MYEQSVGSSPLIPLWVIFYNNEIGSNGIFATTIPE